MNLPRMHPVVLNDDPPCHGVVQPAIVSICFLLSPLVMLWLWPQAPIPELVIFVIKLFYLALFSFGIYLSVRACGSWAEDKGHNAANYKWWGLLPIFGLLRIALLRQIALGPGFPVGSASTARLLDR